MLAELTATELNDWWRYYQVEPWGPQREDGRAMFHAGMIGHLFGGKFDSQLALPSFISDMYGPAVVTEDMLKDLEARYGRS